MTEDRRERTLALFIGIALVLGVAFDLAAGEVRRPKRLPVEGLRLFEKAYLCPGPLGESGTAQISLSAATEEATRYSVPGGDRLREVPPLGVRTLTMDGPGAAVGYRNPIVAASTIQVSEPVEGAGAARCSHVASQDWYFPEGSSALGFDERLILYNPFPDEAVARISFLTPTGDVRRAKLAEGIAVPANEVRIVKLNEYVPPQNMLGSLVQMNRGRVVAWRASIIHPKEQPSGLQFTLGARAPATVWYMPAGSIEEGIDPRVSLMNPGRREAVVSISLVTAEETVQPPKLVEVRVAPQTTMRVVLSEMLGRGQSDLGGAGIVVRSTNDVGVIAERTLWYDLAAVTGVSSEIGAAVARERWIVPQALHKPTTDTLLVLNPGPEPATVTVTVLSESAGPSTPPDLRDIRVRPGTRRRIELSEPGRMLLVEADGPVVVERSATAGRDAAAVLGVPAGE